MAKNNPVRSWAIKQRPSNEPKFHHTEILAGAGRSTTASLAIFNRGWDFRRFAIKVLVVEYNGGFSSHWSRLESGQELCHILC